MSEIPDDIMQSASEAVDKIGEAEWSDEDGCHMDVEEAQAIIARAILAERERCADFARERVFDEHALAQATEYGRGVHFAATEILAAIRTPSTGEATE